MKIMSYGLFWNAHEIEWYPGRGNRSDFRLLGHIGQKRNTIRIADFRHQKGIYILYDDYGPVYVGLTRKTGLGKRIKDHMEDKLADKWDRFSWFGFLPFAEEKTNEGIIQIGDNEISTDSDTDTTIGELEALLIRLICPKENIRWMNIGEAEQWEQVTWDDVDDYIAKLKD